jgi:hypothetical protein
VEGQYRTAPLESFALLELAESDCSELLNQTLQHNALHFTLLE